MAVWPSTSCIIVVYLRSVSRAQMKLNIIEKLLLLESVIVVLDVLVIMIVRTP